MVMVNISDEAHDKLNDLLHDFKKTHKELKVTQNWVIEKALKKLEGDLQ